MLRIEFSSVALLAISISLHAQVKPIDVPVSKLGTKYRLLGKLQKPLGTVVTVQGLVVDGPFKGHEGGPNIRIQRIDGRATQEHIQIKLNADSDDPGIAQLELGRTYELKGYETGKFVGLPNGAPGPENGGATTGFYFSHSFNVITIKRFEPIRWSPADFVDREALLEGKAVSHGKQAYIAGKNWRLLVDTDAVWPKDYEGKTVEGFGMVRRADKPGTYSLAKAATRLVKLEDQVGRKVTLRSTAWSMNGHWWLNYRGTDLYVEDMNELPKWDVDLHGSHVLIEGVLDEALLPDIRQITLKNNRDKIKYFIVRKASWKPIDALLFPERE